MDYYAIGQRIRKNRKARNLSQEDLADMIGISVTHMSHIETGNTKLSLPVLVDLAKAFEVRTDDLLFDTYSGEKSMALNSITSALDSCTAQQLRVIEDLVKTACASLKRHY